MYFWPISIPINTLYNCVVWLRIRMCTYYVCVSKQKKLFGGSCSYLDHWKAKKDPHQTKVSKYLSRIVISKRASLGTEIYLSSDWSKRVVEDNEDTSWGASRLWAEPAANWCRVQCTQVSQSVGSQNTLTDWLCMYYVLLEWVLDNASPLA